MNSPQAKLAASLFPALLDSVTSPATAASSIHRFIPVPSNSTFQIPDGNTEDGIHQWSSLIGIITALCGNVLISLALNIQRYAHIRIAREFEQDKSRIAEIENNGASAEQRSRPPEQYSDSESEFGSYRDDISAEEPNSSSSSRRSYDSFESKDGADGRKSYLKSPYWWVGIVLMVVGEMGNFMAYGFAPASIVSPLGVVALISNCIIAPCLLKEEFRKRDLWGVLVSVAGAVVVVLSAKSSEEKIGPEEIWAMITRWEFELYLGVTISLICGLMWASHKYGSRSILIDVGLVALFGESLPVSSLISRLLLTASNRRIYGAFHERRLVSIIRYPLARNYVSGDISSCFRPSFQRFDANSLYQPGSATLRFDPSYPHTVRAFYTCCDHWKCGALS